MKQNEHVLHAQVHALAQEFEIVGDLALLPSESFKRWMTTFENSPRNERTRIATDLVALAVKFHRLASSGTEDAVIQLAVLTVVVLGERRPAEKMFEAGGFKRRDVEKLMGTLAPSTSVDSKGATTELGINLLDLRVKRTSTSTKKPKKVRSSSGRSGRRAGVITGKRAQPDRR